MNGRTSFFEVNNMIFTDFLILMKINSEKIKDDYESQFEEKEKFIKFLVKLFEKLIERIG